MTKVELEYNVWWWPRKRRKHIAVPSQWQELSEPQFVAVVKAMKGSISPEDYHSTLIGISPSLFSQLDSWSSYMLRQQLAWLDEGKAELSRMIIPSVEGLRAPGNALDGMCFQQFITVDTFFDYFTRSLKKDKFEGDIHLLCRFVAALYLRKREKYILQPSRKTFLDLPGQNEKLVDIDANARWLEKRADRDTLYAIFFNWVLIRAWLSRVYPVMFPGSDGEEQQNTAVKNVWLNAFDAFVGDDVPHMDEYRQMACTDAFRIINKRMKDALTKK